MRTKSLHLCLKYFSFCLLTLFLSGCIAVMPNNSLPTNNAEFRKPPEQLRAEYPAITQFDMQTMSIFHPNLTTYDENQLVAAWGEPDNKKTEWSYAGYMGAAVVGCGFLFGPVPALITGGMVVAIRPYPFEYYYWRKDNYCIEAKFDALFLDAYKERLVYWSWHHLPDGGNIPEECLLQPSRVNTPYPNIK